MLRNLSRALPGSAFAPAAAAAALLALASYGLAQTTAQTPRPAQTPTTGQEQQTQPQPTQAEAARADTTGDATGVKTAAPAAAPAPLYGEYRGVKLGMAAEDVRAKLGKAEEKSDAMDFYVFSGAERARVYYRDGKASAIIATYIGRDARAPSPAAVLGEEIEARADGSMYKMTMYPQAGYWVAYSRTAGDQPMVIITMQKTP